MSYIGPKSLHPQMGKEVKLGYSSIESQMKFLQGNVLTIIDASYTGAQGKAVKDLINSAFSRQLTWILELCAPEMPIKEEDYLKAQGYDTDAIKRGAVEIKS